jgi:hypothetical protein
MPVVKTDDKSVTIDKDLNHWACCHRCGEYQAQLFRVREFGADGKWHRTRPAKYVCKGCSILE